MRIRHVEAWAQEFTLREPYVIAYEEVARVENVFIRLETEHFVGYGCAAPDPQVTGESCATVTRVLTEIAEPILAGRDPLTRARLLTDLEAALEGNPSALAAVDLALHDLLGKAARLPLWRLLGGYRDRIETSTTIGILPLDRTVAAARARVEEGFHHLKIKGGRDVEDDIARVRAVRKGVGSGIRLRFDANQGYSVAEAVHFVDATREAHLDLIEQPTDRDRPDLLGKVTSRVDLPTMADESLMSARDAFHLGGESLVDLVNIKLMKVGGIAKAQRVDAVARTARVATMVGCMDESALAMAGALAFALGSSNVAYADLDGHLDLVDDPAAGMLPVVRGWLHGTEKPGLGVVVPRL